MEWSCNEWMHLTEISFYVKNTILFKNIILPHGEKGPLLPWLLTLLAMVMTIMLYGVDVLHRPASHPSFPIGLVKTESGFTVRSLETSLGR